MEKAKLSSEGDLKAPKQPELGAVQRRTGRRAGHRHEQGNENERRGDVHL